MRVHELAKALNLSSKDLLVHLKALKISAKAATTTLDADTVNRVRKALSSRLVSKKSASTKTPAIASRLAAPLKKQPAKAQSAVLKASVSKPSPVKPVLPLSRSVTSKATTPAKAPIAAMPKYPVGRKVAAAPQSAAVASAPPAPIVKSQPPKTAPVTVPAAQKEKASGVAESKPVVTESTAAVAELPSVAPVKRLDIKYPITVKDLADKIGIKPADVIRYLMQQGIFASIVQALNEPIVTKVAAAFSCEIIPQPTLEEELLRLVQPDPAKLVSRAPVVTFMGHVDHGKTSLLDAIREAKVAQKEAGGITQHIGAYEVSLEKGQVTFLDTPGHEAFSALRARGANVTDVVVLVVAADDGVMPQTVEAIDHAKAADVPIVVAINKVDKPEADLQKVKQQLTQYGLIAEDWGGKNIMVSVSAKTREGIDTLLEMLLLEAELLELKADPTTAAQGVVVEAKQTKDRGPVATLLIQQGTLRIGNTVVVGHLVGRVRALANDRGHLLKEAGPAKPVEVLGLPEVPTAGDTFIVVSDEKLARQLAEKRKEQRAQRMIAPPKRITLDELHQRITEGKLKDLRLIVKADVQGSLEAIIQSLQKLDTEKEEIQFRILHTGVGDINESDITLAAASDAIVIGFHVGIDPKVQVLAAKEGVDVRIYQIIYELVNAIRAAIEGMLEPLIEETFLGRAEVRKLFQVSKVGIIAGCMVVKGSIRRDATLRLIRGRDRLYEGKVGSLKRAKDDVREVQEGMECGISVEGNINLQIGDLFEVWELKKIARKLG
ncbi:MAG: translation initiation factor IF-2 [Candidatus Omnitrophica bacterium]|nr:translation initiation factor IF-2 [Candidatus Omnitrophota bacterium]